MSTAEPTNTDACGVIFSQDGKSLISCPRDFAGEYVIRDGVTDIDHCAFSHCRALSAVTFPSSLLRIGERAFHGCVSLFSLEIPSGVVRIDQAGFFECRGLTEVKFLRGHLKVGHIAFASSYKIQRVIIPDYWTFDHGCVRAFHPETEIVTEIEEMARLQSNSPDHYVPCMRYDGEAVVNSDGVIFSADRKRFRHMPRRYIGEYDVPDGVEVISDSAFAYCHNLTSIRLPDGLSAISEEAFTHCDNLASIVIPDTVELIDFGAFKGCEKLALIIIPDVCRIADNSFPKTTVVRRRSEEEARIQALAEIAPKGIGVVGMPVPEKQLEQ